MQYENVEIIEFTRAYFNIKLFVIKFKFRKIHTKVQSSFM